QHDDARGGVLVGARERGCELAPQVHAQGVELVGPVEGDEADFLGGFVQDELGHVHSSIAAVMPAKAGIQYAVSSRGKHQIGRWLLDRPLSRAMTAGIVALTHDATHCVKRCSIGAMRSDSQWSSSLTDTAMFAA